MYTNIKNINKEMKYLHVMDAIIQIVVNIMIMPKIMILNWTKNKNLFYNYIK